MTMSTCRRACFLPGPDWARSEAELRTKFFAKLSFKKAEKAERKVEGMKHTIALKQNHEFRRLYNKGRSAVSPYFAIYCRKTNRPVSRLGITTGVKLGNAVKRNRARRRIRALYRTNEACLAPGYDIVVVARSRVIYGRYDQLDRSFLQLMGKLGIRQTGEG